MSLELENALLRLAVQDIGGCLTDLGRLLAQGIREDNEAVRGGIAVGLERAALHVRGKMDIPPDKEHMPAPPPPAFETGGAYNPQVPVTSTFDLQAAVEKVTGKMLPVGGGVRTEGETTGQIRVTDPEVGSKIADGKPVGRGVGFWPSVSESKPTFRALGQSSKLSDAPDAAILEKADYDAHGLRNQCFRFTCPEFTSLCPVTGQPDFAHIVIDYVPKSHIIESKSLKLYMASFRNHGEFHESCTLRIASDIVHRINPLWLRIAAYWYPRGGIPIDVFWQSNDPPNMAYIPELTTPQYRGR